MTAMMPPYVLALDIGTSSVRASVYDGSLQPRRATQIRYTWQVAADGRVELNARVLLKRIADAIDGALDDWRRPIDAVATAAFWHSLLGVDGRGAPVTPLLPWSDLRSADEAGRLRATHDERAIHRRTGCRLHPSYWPSRLRWFRANDRRRFARVHRWVSFTEWLESQWLGRDGVSISQASGTGLMVQDTCEWDEDLLDACGLGLRHVAPLVDLGDEAVLRPRLASRWPRLARAAWVPALGDGAVNNAGAGCVKRTQAAVMIGTSGAMRVLWRSRPRERLAVPFGLWRYRLDRHRPIIGGAASNGGNVREWLLRMLAGREDDPGVHRAEQDALQRLADSLPPDAHGLTVLPFLAGSRSPDYLVDARGAIDGLSLATRKEHLLRAGMEAIAYRFGAMNDELRRVATLRHIVAAGGGLERSEAWTQIVADVLGRPVRLCAQAELTSRGAAAIALEQLGVSSLDDIQPPAGRMVKPDPARGRVYRQARERQQALIERSLSASSRRPRRTPRRRA